MEIKLKDVIKRELTARGESINSVAGRTGIPVSTLHNWSQGMLPNAKNLHLVLKLADYLDISLSTLLFNKKEEQSKGSILFSSMFTDSDRRYRVIVEKLPKRGDE